jgi:LAO/AO transport system kinase
LLECADVFAVNKADLPGADAVAENLRAMLMLGHVTAAPVSVGVGHAAAGAHAATERGRARQSAAEGELDPVWNVPVVSCVATRDEGMAGVLAELQAHQRWLGTPTGQERRRERLKQELVGRLREALSLTLIERHRAELDEVAERVAQGQLDPYAATSALVQRWT